MSSLTSYFLQKYKVLLKLMPQLSIDWILLALLVCLDLAFLIDGSNVVGGEGNFKQILNFVWNVVQSFSIGPHLTRVGVVLFSLESFAIFNFHTYYDKSNILQALNTVQYPGSDGPGTYIGRGLRVTSHYLFEQTGRPRVPHALIVVAAGRSLDDVISPSMELRSMGVDVYCVGVGSSYSKLQLHAMASFPHSEHIFGASTTQLGYIAQNVVTKILKGISVHFCHPCFQGQTDMCDFCPEEFHSDIFRRQHDLSAKLPKPTNQLPAADSSDKPSLPTNLNTEADPEESKEPFNDEVSHSNDSMNLSESNEADDPDEIKAHEPSHSSSTIEGNHLRVHNKLASLNTDEFPKGSDGDSNWKNYNDMDTEQEDANNRLVSDELKEEEKNFAEYKYDASRVSVNTEDCKDYADECEQYALQGYCSEYAPTTGIGTINMMCKRSCGTCHSTSNDDDGQYTYKVTQSADTNYFKKGQIDKKTKQNTIKDLRKRIGKL